MNVCNSAVKHATGKQARFGCDLGHAEEGDALLWLPHACPFAVMEMYLVGMLGVLFAELWVKMELVTVADRGRAVCELQ